MTISMGEERGKNVLEVAQHNAVSKDIKIEEKDREEKK